MYLVRTVIRHEHGLQAMNKVGQSGIIRTRGLPCVLGTEAATCGEQCQKYESSGSGASS